MSLLLSLLASSGGFGIPLPKRLELNSNVHIHVDANSLFANWIASGIETVGELGKAIKSSGATSSNSAIPGQSWDDMRLRSDDVDSSYVPGKTNVLIIGETTNQVYNLGSTTEQTIQKAQQYITARKLAHPDWIILLVGTIPRADLSTPELNKQANQKLLEVDNYQRTHLQDMGVHGFVDIRNLSSGWFSLREDGMTAKFMDNLSTCNSYNNIDPDMVHPIGEARLAFANAILEGIKLLPSSAQHISNVDTDIPSNSTKIVPLSLTAGQGDILSSGADLTGRKLVVPMLWGSQVTRFRVHMRNINPRTGTQGTDIPVTISRLGKSTAGVLSETVDLNFSGAVTGGTDYVTPWIEQPLGAGTEYGLEFSYTGQSTDKILQCSGGSYVIPNSGAPWVRRSTPFHIWIEAEVPSSTRVYTFIGDSLTVGLNSSADRTGTLPMFDSWPSKLSRMQGALPIIYAASGDTAQSWITDSSAYKVTLWDNGFAKGDVLFQNMGSNDVFAGVSLDTLKTRSSDIINLMRSRLNENAKIITTSILPRNTVGGSEPTEVTRRELNTWLSSTPSPVDAYKHINFINVISTDDDNIPTEIALDGIHPNASGYQSIAENVNTQLSGI